MTRKSKNQKYLKMHLDLWGEMPDNNCVLSLQSVNIFDKRDETVDDTLQSRTQSSLFQQQEFPQIQQYQSQENVDDDDDADQESFVSNLYLKQKQHFADQINDDQQEEEQAIEYKGHATGDEQPIDFDFENAFIDIPILPLDDGAAMHESIRDTGKDHQQQQQQQADESKAQSETKSHVSSFKEVQEAWHLDGV